MTGKCRIMNNKGRIEEEKISNMDPRLRGDDRKGKWN
jgi:hypothetical protein